MDIREVFALNLRKARQAKGLSQEALAHDSAVDRTYISALERGLYGATIDMVDRLATVLDVKAAHCCSDRQGRTRKSQTGKLREKSQNRRSGNPEKRSAADPALRIGGLSQSHVQWCRCAVCS